MKYKLIDINNIDRIHPSMLDNENRKVHYADMVMEINNNVFIKLSKCRYCSEGLYYHENFLNEIVQKQNVENKDLLVKIEELTDINSGLEKKLLEKQDLKKWWQFWK